MPVVLEYSSELVFPPFIKGHDFGTQQFINSTLYQLNNSIIYDIVSYVKY